jgi:nicotinate-nucleotide pyrophosphorylase (carboxylating)
MDTSRAEVESRARAWLAEDRADDDLTTAALVPPEVTATALMRAKEPGVVAGLGVAAEVFAALDADIRFDALCADGERVESGQVVASLHGACRSLLRGERTALNVVQRMSGIATRTRLLVDAVEGTGAAILATRKTVPGLRALDLAAVRAGGGEAHRSSLAQRVLVKENHLTAARLAGTAESMSDVVVHLTGAGTDVGAGVGIEVTDLDELRAALVPGVDVVLLDNFSPASCAEAVRLRAEAYPDGGGPALEASGGITLENVRAFAEAGVERISLGAPTHSAPALDVSMKITPPPEPAPPGKGSDR